MAKKKKFYAVVKGKTPGIYTEWFGDYGAELQIKGFQGAIFKGFATYEEATVFMNQNGDYKSGSKSKRKHSKPVAKSKAKSQSAEALRDGEIIIYTDGGCINNPGPGGYGVVILNGKQRKELSGGFRLTTNNRMELMACIVALKSLKSPTKVTLYCDSKYVVNGISKGWAMKWRSNGWKKANKENALNPDLWEQLLKLSERHEVDFIWVKGHAGNFENERCDTLANSVACEKNLPVDENYESQARVG